MNYPGLLFLLLVHFITGLGLIELMRLQLSAVRKVCLAVICGVAVASFVPFFMELGHIALTHVSVAIGLLIPAALACIPLFPKLKTMNFKGMKWKLPEIYEYPFIAIFVWLVVTSVWRCYYNPPVAWDMLSGPEAMADIAIREKHLINSLFTVDLQNTNNYLKPPYVASLQVIYKLFVQEFGQLWLSVLFVSFIGFLFSLLREKLHPVIMYVVMIFFFECPELYAYSYVILFDYSNMIFFFLGFYFLNRYFENKTNNELAFAIFSFSVATYIRSETLVLLVLILPLLVFRLYKQKLAVPKLLMRTGAFLLFPYLVYFLFMNIYVKHYIPIHFDVAGQVNKNLGDLHVLYQRLHDITTTLLFGTVAETYFGMFNYLFVCILLVDIIFYRKFNSEAITAIYGVLVVFFGLGLLGYMLPLVDLLHTTKRGLFKLFPLMLLYFRNSSILITISTLISGWEAGTLKSNKKEPQRKVVPVPQRPVVNANKPVKKKK